MLAKGIAAYQPWRDGAAAGGHRWSCCLRQYCVDLQSWKLLSEVTSVTALRGGGAAKTGRSNATHVEVKGWQGERCGKGEEREVAGRGVTSSTPAAELEATLGGGRCAAVARGKGVGTSGRGQWTSTPGSGKSEKPISPVQTRIRQSASRIGWIIRLSS